MRGFFSPTTWGKQKHPLPLLPECKKCKLELGCNTPHMPVSGEGKRKILIVAEAPGETEDDQGVQLIGNSGQELIRMISNAGGNMRKDCWLTNAIVCRPPKNRTPTTNEVNFCRPNLAKTLLELKPDVVIPLGMTAVKSLIPLAWKDGEVDEMTRWVGWRIPCQRLNTWICPTWHPSFYLRGNDPVVEYYMTKHLRATFALKGKPWEEVPDWRKKVQIITDDEKARQAIVLMMAFGPKMVAFDYETNMLKPDSDRAEILCCSLSNGTDTIAFPWVGKVKEQMSTFLKSSIPKVAANLKFEDRWTRKMLGHGVTNWLGGWDTMLGAHWRDCRHGITSLKFQAFVLLGMPDYDSYLDPYKKAKGGGNAMNRMKEVEPQMLLEYCGLDSLLEIMVAQKQMENKW